MMENHESCLSRSLILRGKVPSHEGEISSKYDPSKWLDYACPSMEAHLCFQAFGITVFGFKARPKCRGAPDKGLRRNFY